MTCFDDDFVPVTGGVDLPKDYLRDDLHGLRDQVAGSDLDKHIARLLALHPQVRVRYRNQDLDRLDTATKQRFLQDINDLLGIRPLDLAGK